MKKGLLFKIIVILTGVAALDLLLSKAALAWGPGVHTVIGLNTLEFFSGVASQISSILTSNPVEYLYGSLAADFFFMKSEKNSARHAHHWKGGFKFLREASNDKETAYAYGFLSHLAADVVAHNIFVPNLMSVFPGKGKMGHIYWEIKADYHISPIYLKIAKDILNMDHMACDEILHSITGRTRNGMKVRKHIFAQSVKFSDYLYNNQALLFSGKVIRWEAFRNYVSNMISLSSHLVQDFLQNPLSSPCLTQDPLGREKLRFVKRKGLWFRLFNPKFTYQSTNRPHFFSRHE